MGFRDSERFRKTYSYFRPPPKNVEPIDVVETIRGIDWKQSVRIASTTNVDITLGIPPSSITTIDSGAGALILADEDRILLKDQTIAAENGIYIWYASNFKLTRTLDAVQDTLTSGAACYVEEGTYAQTVWFLTTPDPITVDSTNQTWTQIFGGIGGGDSFFTSSIAGAIYTSGSTAFIGAGDEFGVVTSPYQKGSDVFFYVSGSINGSGVDDKRALFGGDVRISGSFSQGSMTSATGLYSHAEGEYTNAVRDSSHAEGNSTIAGVQLFAALYGSFDGSNPVILLDAYYGDVTGEFGVGNNLIIRNSSTGYVEISNIFGASYDAILLQTAITASSFSQGQFDPLGICDVFNLASVYSTSYIGSATHAEGISTIAISDYAHAEGAGSIAAGLASHAEGADTIAAGVASHAEGNNTIALGDFSHAGGSYTIASGSSQTVIGKYNKRNNSTSLFVVGDGVGDDDADRSDILRVNGGPVGGTGQVEVTGSLISTLGLSGSLTQLVDGTSYLIAGANIVIVSSSNGAVTISSTASGGGDSYFSSSYTGSIFTTGSVAFRGIENISSSYQKGSDVFFYASGSISGSGANDQKAVFGGDIKISGSVLQGQSNSSVGIGMYSFAANNSYALAENSFSANAAYSTAQYSFAIGTSTAAGDYSHAEGAGYASGDYSHAEGFNSEASGSYSHAEGYETHAIGDYSHSEGDSTYARGVASHAEGVSTEAIGIGSHAEGLFTIASGSNQHVQGKYNKRGNNFSLFVIGDGTGDADTNRSDIIRVNPGASGGQGSLQLTGSLYVSGTSTFDSQGRSVSQIGDDVYFFVSGSSGSLGTSTRGVAAFGGDVIVSGSLKVGTGSVTITSNDVQFGGANTRIEKSSSDLKFYDASNPSGVTLSSLAAGAGAPSYWTSPSDGLANTTGSVSIQGDLTVNGTTVTVNTTNLEVKDAVIGLGFSSGTIAQTAGDRGFIAGLSGADNATLLWKNASSEFVVGRTASSATGSLPITLTGYSDFRAATVKSSGAQVTGSLYVSGSSTFDPQGRSTGQIGSDVFLFVSGSLNGANKSVFGGDVRVSGSINTNLLTASNANITTLVNTTATSSYFTVTNEFVLATDLLEVTGNIAVTNSVSASYLTGTYIRSQDIRANTLTGSLTKLFDGTSYLIAGSGIQITTGSNGAVTISSTGGGGTSGDSFFSSSVAGSIFTTGSAAFRGSENITSPSSKGSDVFFYVSGSLTGTNKSLFGGFVTVSGTMSASVGQFSQLTSSFFRVTDSFVSSADQLEITGTLIVTGSARVTGSLYATGASTFDSQGRSTSQIGSDVFFFVSGSLNGANKSVFGGDVRVSGSLNTNFLTASNGSITNLSSSQLTASYLNVSNEFTLSANVLEITGNLYVTQNVVASTVSASFLSGSLTRLSNGQSYLVAGNNVTIASQSNGSILISSTGGGGGDSFFSSSVAGSIFTTGSAAFRGSENISSPSSKGSDVFFYVSGSISGSGANDRKSLFGGDVRVSGSIITDAFIASGDILEVTGNVLVTNSISSSFITGTFLRSQDVRANTLTGSLTKLFDGTSYLIAGNNLTITTGSSGAVTIGTTVAQGSIITASYFDSTTAGAIFTTGSAAFRGLENITSPTSKGTDVFFYVSGSLNGSNKSLFGGDVRVSGSINTNLLTASNGNINTLVSNQTTSSYFTVTNEFVLATNVLEITGNLYVTSVISSSYLTGTYIRSQDIKSNALTGSLTKLFDGTSYLIAGSGIQITTGSNGAVTITNDGTIGDITAVTAGTGLTGGGTSGAVTLNINDSVVATVSGTTFTGVTKHDAGLSGSLTRLTDGTSYLIAGNNVTITSQSNGPITISSSPGGTNTNVQFNDGGLFGGVSGFTFDKTTNSLVVPNLTASIGGYFENIFVTGTASIGLLETRNQQSLMVGDKYIVLATGSIDHATLDGSGLLYGSGSTGPTVDSLGANAHILFRAASDSLEIFPNLTVTGSTSNVGDLSVTGSIYASKISGSITKLVDGSSYLIAGDNVSIVSQSNGSILISSTDTTGSTLWADGGNKLLATGSVSIDSSARFVDVIGDDVYFFVSGSSGSMGTSIRGVAAFGGDVMITGSLKVGTGSIVITSNDIQFGDVGTRIERSGNDIKFFDVNNPTGTTLSSMVGGGGGDSYWSSTVTDAIYATGSVAVRGGDSIFSANEVGTDVFFYVSGSKTSTGRPASGVAVLGGDLVLSGALYLGDSSVSSIYDSQGGSLIYTTNPGGSTLILGKDVVLNTNVIKANDFSTAITLQSSNVTVSGALTASLGLSGSLTQLADGTSYLIAGSNVTITSASNGPITISAAGSGFIPGSDNNLLTSDGAGAASAETNLNFDGSILSVTGSIEPGTDSTYNLGSPEKRWANVYTGDLHLKNDRGDWTLIEEEECLTVRNNVTGKRYKISMTPMD